jgi:hypothetical protein
MGSGGQSWDQVNNGSYPAYSKSGVVTGAGGGTLYIGNNWATVDSDPFGSSQNPANTWTTEETEVVQSTAGNIDGTQFAWLNGCAGTLGNSSTGYVNQTLYLWNTRAASGAGSGVLDNMVNPVGEFTVNTGSFGSTVWTPSTQFLTGAVIVSPGINPRTGVPYAYVNSTYHGTSASGSCPFDGRDRIVDGTATWQNVSEPLNNSGVSGLYVYLARLYLDDSKCRIILGNEPSGYSYTQTTTFYRRKPMIPVAWDGTGANISAYITILPPSGNTDNMNVVDSAGTSHSLGTLSV